MQKAESKGERNNVKMRTRTKKFNTVLVVIFLLVCCMLILQSDECFAAPRTGNIEIDFKGRTDDIDDVLLSGAKFEIFPIQYMDNGMMVWRDEFAKCGVSLDDTSSEAREKQAKQLFQYAKDHNITGIIHTTDSNGHTYFLDLAEGMYLLAEIGDVTEGVDVFDSEPFLVRIPSEISGKFEYDVDVEPKAEWISHEGHPVGPDPEPEPEPIPNDTTTDEPGQTLNHTKEQQEGTTSIENPVVQLIHRVKTGDTNQVFLWGGIMVASVLAILCVNKRYRR